MSDTDPLLTPQQVAEQLRVTAVTINKWADEGKLRAIRLPSGRYRFHRSDIEEMLDTSPHATGATA